VVPTLDDPPFFYPADKADKERGGFLKRQRERTESAHKEASVGGHHDNPGLPARNGEEFVMKKIEWLWPGWLARGKLHLIAGSKGAGKSTIAYDLAARVTATPRWPDGTAATALGDVIVWSGEDNIEDTILPRFVAAGGDLKRIYPIREIIVADSSGSRPFDPSTDVPALIDLATKLPNPILCIIDPVVMAMPAGSDSHKNSETRRGLQPLVDFAERRGVALLGVTHFTKGTGDRDPIERVTGSLAFGALPRCVWAAGADDDGHQRRLVRIASNIGPSGDGIEYMLFQAPLLGRDDGLAAQRINWGRQIKGSARELLDATKRSSQATAAVFLREFLASGPQSSLEVKKAADAHGHSWATVRLAQQALGIKPKKNGKGWDWGLPDTPRSYH
jgi:hypothetical protein